MKNYTACRVKGIDNGSVMQIKIACVFQGSHIVPKGPEIWYSSLLDKTKLCPHIHMTLAVDGTLNTNSLFIVTLLHSKRPKL